MTILKKLFAITAATAVINAEVIVTGNPHYLDTPPAGAVQRCHRGHVVQLMNEVHSTGTLGRPRPLAVPARASTP